MSVFDLKIGFKCNNDCKHCVVADKRPSGNLSLEDLLFIIDTLPSIVDTIQITGGEPSISPYLVDVVKYCKSKNLRVWLQTNATGFSNKALADEVGPYIDHALVAIHSNVEEVHDLIVGGKGMWKKTLEGLKNLSQFNIDIATQTVLSTYNIETLYTTYQMIQELYPGMNMHMTYPHMMGNAYSDRETVCFRYIDHKKVLQDCLRDFGHLIITESIPFCYLFPYHDKVTTIEDWIRGNYLRNDRTRIGIDFSQDMEEKNYDCLDITSRKKAPKCRECVFYSRCIGVWKEYIDLFKSKLDLYPITEEEFFKEGTL